MFLIRLKCTISCSYNCCPIEILFWFFIPLRFCVKRVFQFVLSLATDMCFKPIYIINFKHNHLDTLLTIIKLTIALNHPCHHKAAAGPPPLPLKNVETPGTHYQPPPARKGFNWRTLGCDWWAQGRDIESLAATVDIFLAFSNGCSRDGNGLLWDLRAEVLSL